MKESSVYIREKTDSTVEKEAREHSVAVGANQSLSKYSRNRSVLTVEPVQASYDWRQDKVYS